MTFLEECVEFSGPAWDRYLHHPWIEAFFSGELSEERFNYWLIQNLTYLGSVVSEIAYPKVPPHNPWIAIRQEYARIAKDTRVELKLMDEAGEMAKSRWAARPTRDALINFWVRTMHEGSFGEVCSASYVCHSFPLTFGDRYLSEKPKNLTELQKEWVEQWIEPIAYELLAATTDGINEYGANSTEFEKEKMRWLFLRGTQLQIGTFDAAWNLSDPWPGEGEEKGVLAGKAN